MTKTACSATPCAAGSRPSSPRTGAASSSGASTNSRTSSGTSSRRSERHGIGIAEEYGGQGGTIITQALFARELARTAAGIGWVWGVTSFSGSKAISFCGSEEQKQRFLPKIAAGELKTAMAFSEPGGGTDLLGGMKTTARRVEGGWVINGEKIWSTCANVADYLFLMARSNRDVQKRSDGISIFFVPRNAKGVTVTELSKLGMRCVASCSVHLDEVFVPDELLLGEEGKGWYQSTRTLNNERLMNAATCLGMLDGVIEDALDHMKTRRAFGKVIGEFQILQHYLADMAMWQKQGGTAADAHGPTAGGRAAERHRVGDGQGAVLGVREQGRRPRHPDPGRHGLFGGNRHAALLARFAPAAHRADQQRDGAQHDCREHGAAALVLSAVPCHRASARSCSMLPPSLIEATTLGDLLLRAAARWPEREALVFPHARLTYRELAERACVRARALIAMGVEPGDHVGILSLNLPEMIETLFASALSGAVAVLLNARYRVDELRYVIGNADLRLLFTSTRFEAHGDFPALLRAALPGLPTSGSGAPAAATPLLRAMVALERAPGSGLLCGEEFLARAADVSEQQLTARRAQVALGAPCIMMYTSGTTSQPKGCRLSHEAVVRSALGMNRRLGISGEDIMWNPLPMFHMASILPLLSLVWSGGCFLSDVHFDAGRALAQIRATRATVLYPAFPAIMADLLNHPAFDAQRLDSVRLVSNVAPPDTLRANMHVLPRAVHVSAYGMTEASGISCHGAPDEDDETRATSCGRPYDGVQMRVVDPETGRVLGAGERGEMRIRGFSLFEGYYKDPQRTAEAFDSEGWFRTGDLCSIGAGGQVCLSRPSQGPAEDRRRERVTARAGVLHRHASGGADGAGGRGSRCAAAGGCGGVHPVAPGHVRLGGGNRGVLSRPDRLVQDSAPCAFRDANGRCRPPRSRSTCCARVWSRNSIRDSPDSIVRHDRSCCSDRHRLMSEHSVSRWKISAFAFKLRRKSSW